MGATIAYCRVSSRDQNPELQLDALDTHGYDRLFAETESGKRGVERPEFTTALSALQPGDTLVFWKSDRWGRSAAHVLTTINELRDRGVRVKSLTENFDLDTKEGRFMFAVLAAAAEYELELRAERQAEGIAAAQRRQAEGRMLPGKKHIGRPKVTGPAEIATLRRLVADGASVTQAARTLKISRSTAYAALASTRADPQPRITEAVLPQVRDIRPNFPRTTGTLLAESWPVGCRGHGLQRGCPQCGAVVYSCGDGPLEMLALAWFSRPRGCVVRGADGAGYGRVRGAAGGPIPPGCCCGGGGYPRQLADRVPGMGRTARRQKETGV